MSQSVVNEELIHEKSSSILRRSSRKRSMPAIFSSSSKPAKMKSCTASPSIFCPSAPAPSLLSLPFCAISRLLLYIDVDSLEQLSSTCYYFDQLIQGRFLTSIDFPFSASFIEEISSGNCFDKKPLLKLRCKKTKECINVSRDLDNFIGSTSHYQLIHTTFNSTMIDYLVMSQMSLLSLHKLREVDLVPDINSLLPDSRPVGQLVLNSFINFDKCLLTEISRVGSLRFLTRLSVLVDHNMYLDQFMDKLPNLVELGLHILTKTLSTQVHQHEYIPRLEAVVAASKAPVLKVIVISENKRHFIKMFKNSFVEKLVVIAPCTFNVILVMERLKEVVVSWPLPCTYWKSKPDDRLLHRSGLCSVHFGPVYKHCPNVQSFMGIQVGKVSQKQSYSKWNKRVKLMFYENYIKQGGIKDIKAWAKARWFSKFPEIPKDI